MWSKQFWLDLLERGIKSGSQFAVIVWAAATFTKFGEVLPTAELTALAFLSGFVASAFTSLGSAKIGSVGTASVLPEVTYVDPDPGDAT